MNQKQEHIWLCLEEKKENHLSHLWREVLCVNPLEGRIIMFPSWLWHSVQPNKSNDIRISVLVLIFLQKGFNV